MTTHEPNPSNEATSAARPKTIGLCMIVKNEAHVITRCLDSVRPLIDYVLIEDTGSTDGTQDIIREWLVRENVPGVVIDEPWQNFAHNRSHALAKLREVTAVDYALIIDADDQLVIEDGFDPVAFKAAMRHGFYDVQIRLGALRYWRPQLCANALPFSYKAVVHEYLEVPPGNVTRSDACGFHVESGRDGARSKNPKKYLDDAAVLEKALLTETDPFLISRYRFYLAQSYRDGGEREKALSNYRLRATLGFWKEEVFVSLYQAARMMEQLGHPEQEVIDTYLQAAEMAPTRAEALHGASRYCRLRKRYEEGYRIARRGLSIGIPTGALFVESWIYETGLLDELAVNAYWAGHPRDCLDACLKLLATGKLSPSDTQRVIANATFAAEKWPGTDAAAPAAEENAAEERALEPVA